MTNQCKLDIKLGPFYIFGFPLKAKLVRGEKVIFSGRLSSSDPSSRRDAFLHSWPTVVHDVPDYRRDQNQIIYTTYRAPRYWVATDGDPEIWLKGLSRNTRQSLRRKRKRIAEAGNGKHHIRRYDRPDAMAMFHRQARQLSKKTFHERKLREGFPDDPAFITNIRDRAAKGLGYGSILFLDDKPVSYVYCEMHGRRCIPSYRGFDPEYKRLSVGLVHHAALIEDAFQNPACDVFDFGLTTFQYKEQLATDRLNCANVLVLSDTIRHRTAITLHRASACLTTWAVHRIEAWGLKKRVQQWLRGTN